MKKALLIALAVLFASGIVLPQASEARVFVSARFGGGCCGYGYYPYYAPYYDPYYVAPPPVVYAVPPAPTVVYPAPDAAYAYAPATTAPAAPPPAYAPAPAAAAHVSASSQQPSPTFVDSQGRTCRHVQITSTVDTICLQQDGSWRTVQ